MKKRIIINGTEYPVRMTMGALLRFKQQTGKDVSEVNSKDVSDMVILLWCAVASACAADKVLFELSLEEFADSLSPDALTLLDEEAGPDEAKKKTE